MALPVSLGTVLQTERLACRAPRGGDVGTLLAALRRNDAHLRPFTPSRSEGDRRVTLASVARDIAAARRAWKRDDSYTFYAFARDADGAGGDVVVARVTLGRVLRGAFQNSFLGYWCDVDHQRRGYITEAVEAVVAFAFGELALHRVQAGVMPRNVPSIRVLEKLGFRKEGLAERYLQIAGKWEDHVLFALTREEWKT